MARRALVVSLASLLAVTLPAAPDLPSIALDGETWFATELARETFADATWRDRWAIEGDAVCIAHDGRLCVATSDQPGSQRAATIWWRHSLPADLLVELIAGVDLPAAENAANLNLFFHAREQNGGGYRFGRPSTYADYQEIPNYVITLTGGFQDGWSRVRRNPGFTLLSEKTNTRAEPGRTYHLRAMIASGCIRYWLDGRLVHDTRDPQPLRGGHFALRTWRSKVWWSEIRLFSLSRASRALDRSP